jgi:DNA-binding transcriptional LysR family regulator
VPMVSARQVDALLAGEIDAGFVYAPVEGVAGIASRSVLAHDFVLALPGKHRLAARRALRLRDLADEPFIWQTRGVGHDRRGAALHGRRSAAPYERTRARIYDRMLAACQKGGLTPRIVAELDTAEARLNLVAAGMGLCFVDDLQRGSAPDVALRRVSDLSVRVEMSLVWRNDAGSPILAAFIDMVKKR